MASRPPAWTKSSRLVGSTGTVGLATLYPRLKPVRLRVLLEAVLWEATWRNLPPELKSAYDFHDETKDFEDRSGITMDREMQRFYGMLRELANRTLRAIEEAATKKKLKPDGAANLRTTAEGALKSVSQNRDRIPGADRKTMEGLLMGGDQALATLHGLLDNLTHRY